MKQSLRLLRSLSLSLITMTSCFFEYMNAATNPNQTETTSPILSGKVLPFQILIEEDFQLPFGIQSFASANIDGKWLFIAGRIAGLHGFDSNNNNFPISEQNNQVIVVDPAKKKVYYRALSDPNSGLTVDQIESLSVTNPQFYQVQPPSKKSTTLYVSGGYGFRSKIQNFTTWPILTSIDVRGLMHWVTHPNTKRTAADYIKQVEHPRLAVTGGFMDQLGRNNPTLLCVGQDFEGAYFSSTSTQVYTQQIRVFKIHDGDNLSVEFIDPNPLAIDPNYRRRDLNVCRVLRPRKCSQPQRELVAFSGVFTEAGGIWTVPITISNDGESNMENPADPLTFKQGMNNYSCANIGLYSQRCGEMYNIFFGGISYGYFSNGLFITDTEFPFINQVTAIKSSDARDFTQYILDTTYPVILSQNSNPGNQLLFGAAAQFMQKKNIPAFSTQIIALDRIRKPKVIGYIVGGIQSTLPNTSQTSDSSASPYVFKVTLIPKESL